MTTTTIVILGLRWEFSSDKPSMIRDWALFALASLFIIAGALQ